MVRLHRIFYLPSHLKLLEITKIKITVIFTGTRMNYLHTAHEFFIGSFQ